MSTTPSVGHQTAASKSASARTGTSSHARARVQHSAVIPIRRALSASRASLFHPSPLPKSSEPFRSKCTGDGQSGGSERKNAAPSSASAAPAKPAPTMTYGEELTALLRREYSFSAPLFLQDDRLGGTNFRGEQNLLIAVAPGIRHSGDELLVELENLWHRLDALAVTLALRAIHGDLHIRLLPAC